MSEYGALVAEFRALTSIVHDDSQRCCGVVRNGVPKCCYQILDGEELTFTAVEIALLSGVDGSFRPRADGMFVLDRNFWTPQVLADGLNDGWLAATLESASHPTRPVLFGNKVTGVVVIDDCNGVIGLEHYQKNADTLLGLWQWAMDLVGAKAYYCTYSIRPGWVLL